MVNSDVFIGVSDDTRVCDVTDVDRNLSVVVDAYEDLIITRVKVFVDNELFDVRT